MSIREGDTFERRGRTMKYLAHPYNDTAINERAVEIPLALDWLGGRDPLRGLEVGCVTPHYAEPAHPVVDRWEEGPSIINLDVFDIEGTFDWILCVSTLEHIRWDAPEERELDGSYAAAVHLLGLLAPDGVALATVPFGQNPVLDESILRGQLRATHEGSMVLERANPDEGREYDTWTWHEGERIWRPATGLGTAASVWIGEWWA